MARALGKEEKQEKAFKTIMDLDSDDRIGVIARAFMSLNDDERQDIIDHLALEESKKESARPLEEFLAEWETLHKKKIRR